VPVLVPNLLIYEQEIYVKFGVSNRAGTIQNSV
jgi:hypothetical protein